MKSRFSAVAAAIATLMVLPGTASASGFAVAAQSASGLGNANAGATAGAEDASTVFFNPAGMAQLQGKQVALAGSLISSSLRFTDTGSQPAGTGAGLRPLGDLPDSSNKSAFIPAAYFVMEAGPRLHLGLGVNAPFGSKTEYPSTWLGRYQAVKSSIETLNVNPSLSWQVNDALSLGAGLNYQKVKASLTNYTVLSQVAVLDGFTTMDGSDAAWGYNFGGLIKLQSGARIGVSYRSPIQFKLSGTAHTSAAVTIAGITNTAIPVTADLKVPASWSFGYFKPLNDKWDVMADLTRTDWSSFNELRVIKVADGSTVSLTQEGWKNVWRVAVGASYHYNERWTARAGLAYDADPVPDSMRTARLPDSDRTVLSLGGQYRLGKADALDLGYAHIFLKSEPINRNVGGPTAAASTANYGQVTGSYGMNADILSVQYSHGF